MVVLLFLRQGKDMSCNGYYCVFIFSFSYQKAPGHGLNSSLVGHIFYNIDFLKVYSTPPWFRHLSLRVILPFGSEN